MSAPSRKVRHPVRRSGFFNLTELQLDRRGTPKNHHRDAHAALFVIDLFDHAIEVREWPLLDAHLLAHHELHLVPWLVGAFDHVADDALHLGVGNGGRPVLAATDETLDLVSVLDQVPGIVVHHHLDQHITREQAPFRRLALAVLHLHDLLGRHQDAAELVLHAGPVDALLYVALPRLFHAQIGVGDVPAPIGVGFHPTSTPPRLFHAQIGVDDVPAQIGMGCSRTGADFGPMGTAPGQSARRGLHLGDFCSAGHDFFHPKIKSYKTHSSVLSVSHRKSAMTTTKANTYAVICSASLRVGQTTLPTSCHASRAKARNWRPGPDSRNTPAAATSPAISVAHCASAPCLPSK